MKHHKPLHWVEIVNAAEKAAFVPSIHAERMVGQDAVATALIVIVSASGVPNFGRQHNAQATLFVNRMGSDTAIVTSVQRKNDRENGLVLRSPLYPFEQDVDRARESARSLPQTYVHVAAVLFSEHSDSSSPLSRPTQGGSRHREAQ